MSFLSAPGAQVFFDIWGEGDTTLFLVNGFMRPHNDFRMLGRFLVAEGFRVVTLDNRGVGQTQAQDSFNIDDMAEDVSSLIQEYGTRKNFLLGISMGGMIAQKVALKFSHLLSGLILVSTTANAKRWTRNRFDLTSTSTHQEVFGLLQHYVSQDFYCRNSLLLNNMSQQIAKNLSEESYRQKMTWQKQAVENFSVVDDLKELKTPCLIMHGEQDEIISPESAKELTCHISNSRIVIFSNKGHLLLAESLAELKENIISFMRMFQ